MTDDRFRPGDALLSDFGGDVLAVCPSCGGCAHVRPYATNVRRGTCARCAWTGEGPGWSLGLPLWLRTDVAGHELWAFNAAHLAHLEQYVGATLRERGERDPARRRPMVDKLPAWLKEAKHREAVLAGVARLRRRLADA